jgi:hypothetical protein
LERPHRQENVVAAGDDVDQEDSVVSEDLVQLQPMHDGTMRVVRVPDMAAVSAALRALGLDSPSPVLVLVGGAGGVGEEDQARLRPLFEAGLAPLAEARGAAVVDGGTDAGVMRLMGQARAEIGASFPLVGVAPAARVEIPDAPSWPDAVPLEPRHTHVVLVPAATWDDGARWLARAAEALAGGSRSVTVLVNGGEVTWEDAAQSIRAGRPVVAVGGTGRVADALAAAAAGEATDARAEALVASGLLLVVDVEAGPAALAEAIGRLLDRKE